MTELLSRHWWSVALRGVAAVFFGLVALTWPGLTLGALIIVFGAYALVDGVFAAIAAVRAAQDDRRWSTLLLESVLGIGFGLVAVAWPGLTALALMVLIACWAIVTGVLEIATAIRLRQEIEGEWLLGLGGVGSVAFGLFALLFPGGGALALVWLIGAYAVFFGAVLIALSVRLRAHQDRFAGGQPGHAAPAGSH